MWPPTNISDPFPTPSFLKLSLCNRSRNGEYSEANNLGVIFKTLDFCWIYAKTKNKVETLTTTSAGHFNFGH